MTSMWDAPKPTLDELLGEDGLAGASLEELEEAAAGGVDVTNWRTADVDDIAGLWGPLREWVEWAIGVYDLTTSQVPPCWWRHPAITQELYALQVLHEISYAPTDQGSGPYFFHEKLALSLGRIKSMVQGTGCTSEHRAPTPRAMATAISTYEWADLIEGAPAHEPRLPWPTWVAPVWEGPTP